MTFRTSSATRRKVVSRSSVVLTTSATSSSNGSTADTFPTWVWETPTVLMISVSRNRTADAGCRGLFPWNDANVGQIPVPFRVIKTVADNKFVGDFEAHIIAFNRLFSAGRFIK